MTGGVTGLEMVRKEASEETASVIRMSISGHPPRRVDFLFLVFSEGKRMHM